MKGGKFTEKGSYRSAWNNFVHLMYKHQKEQYKTIKKMAKKWQDEKLIEDIRTFEEIFTQKETKKLNECLLPLTQINDYLFEHTRGKKYNSKGFNTLYNAMFAYSFYPTPEKTSKLIHDAVVKQGNLNILDIGSGTGSLSIPFIKSGKYDKLTMVEMNPDFSSFLKCFEEYDENIKVIEKDIFSIKSDAFGKVNVIIMNPPFEKNLYLKFIIKALDILMSSNTAYPELYVICPTTAIKEYEIKFPKSLINDTLKDKNIINKDPEDYEPMQIVNMGTVDGFMGISRRGDPIPLGITPSLFNIMSRF